jgi:hypothetical protein
MGKPEVIIFKNKDEADSNSSQIQGQGKANQSSIQRW